MKRVHECKYDDSSRRSRTSQLREKLALLEAKLRDLERDSACSSQVVSPLALSVSSATTGSERSFDSEIEPTVNLSAEMHSALYVLHKKYTSISSIWLLQSIQTFIRHRRQCCFYTNTSRFDSLSSATLFQRRPLNPSLMSAICLLGSFFSNTPLPNELQNQLLERALRNLTQSLHNQEHLMDVVQASCLIAQYFFFNNRLMEGNRHLLAAKRMAFDLGLYSLSDPDISDYAYDSVLQDSSEKSAVFWQVFMVDKFWSATNHCDGSLPDRFSYRYSTTPLPVKEGMRLVSPLIIIILLSFWTKDNLGLECQHTE